MNSISDLNNISATPVTFDSFREYEIVFGNNAGNISTEQFEGSYYRLSKQVELISIDKQTRDLILTLEFSNNATVSNVEYIGPSDRIKVLAANSTTWSVTGIEGVNGYNEAFANVFVVANNNVIGNTVINTQVSDQLGNTRSWAQAVELVTNNLISLPANLQFAEDTQSSLSGLQIIDVFPDASYSLSLQDTGGGNGNFKTAIGNTITTLSETGQKTALNTLLTGAVYIPAADSVSNSSITVNIVRTTDNKAFSSQLPVIWNGTSHTDFSIPTTLSTSEDLPLSLSSIEITDLRPELIDSSIQYEIVLSSVNPGAGQIRFDSNIGNSITISGTKSQINTNLTGNLQFVPSADYTGPASITYTQTQTTDNVLQANAVAIPITVGNPHTDFSIPISYSLAEDTVSPMGNISITDLRPDRVDSSIQYEINIVSQDPGNIKIRYDNVDSAAATLTGNKAQLNSILANANLQPKIIPSSDYFGNSIVTYTQVQTTNNVVQANAVPIGINVSDTSELSLSLFYLYPVGEPNPAILQPTRILYNIEDTDLFATSYTISINQSTGPTGTFLLNGVNQNSSSITFTSDRNSVNSANIAFALNSFSSDTVTLSFSLSKTLENSSTVIIANNRSLTLEPAVTNLDTIYSYTTNNSTQIFSVNRPIINTALTGSLTVTLASDDGYFNQIVRNYNQIDTATILNSDGSVNNLALLNFWPNRGKTDNVAIDYTLVRDNIVFAKYTIVASSVEGTVPNELLGTITINNTSLYEIGIQQFLYCTANVTLIGGGGAAAVGGGGGGGGGVTTINNIQFPSLSNFAVIGAGGTAKIDHTLPGINNLVLYFGNANPGGNTTFINNTAGGGGGGYTSFDSAGARLPAELYARGGTSGSPQNRVSSPNVRVSQNFVALTNWPGTVADVRLKATGGAGAAQGTSGVSDVVGGNGLPSIGGSGGGAFDVTYTIDGNVSIGSIGFAGVPSGSGQGGQAIQWTSSTVNSTANGQSGKVIITWFI